MAMRTPFAIGEWYHCYNRGVEKRRVFESKKDYERFLTLMFVANGTHAVHLSNLKGRTLEDILCDVSLDRGERLVEIGAYALMSNHFHFLLKELVPNGIASFMQKLGTGYTMYFNKKNERTGALFAGVFKSKHVTDDRYIKRLISYIHLNPCELFESGWKEGRGNLRKLEKELLTYKYSSFIDFMEQETRPERKIIGDSVFELFDSKLSIEDMLREATAYYQETNLIKAKP